MVKVIDIVFIMVGIWLLSISFYLLNMALFALKTRKNTNRLNNRLKEIEDWIQELYKLGGMKDDR